MPVTQRTPPTVTVSRLFAQTIYPAQYFHLPKRRIRSLDSRRIRVPIFALHQKNKALARVASVPQSFLYLAVT